MLPALWSQPLHMSFGDFQDKIPTITGRIRQSSVAQSRPNNLILTNLYFLTNYNWSCSHLKKVTHTFHSPDSLPPTFFKGEI